MKWHFQLNFIFVFPLFANVFFSHQFYRRASSRNATQFGRQAFGRAADVGNAIGDNCSGRSCTCNEFYGHTNRHHSRNEQHFIRHLDSSSTISEKFHQHNVVAVGISLDCKMKLFRVAKRTPENERRATAKPNSNTSNMHILNKTMIKSNT